MTGKLFIAVLIASASSFAQAGKVKSLRLACENMISGTGTVEVYVDAKGTLSIFNDDFKIDTEIAKRIVNLDFKSLSQRPFTSPEGLQMIIKVDGDHFGKETFGHPNQKPGVCSSTIGLLHCNQRRWCYFQISSY